MVVGPVTGDARDSGLRFTLRDIEGEATVPVVYTGSVPDLFKVGREVYVKGELTGRHLRGDRGLARHEVPVEVRARTASAVPELGRAALVVALGLILYAVVAGAYAAWRGRRRLLDSATNALFAAFAAVGGRLARPARRSRPARLLLRLRRRAHEPRAAARLRARRLLERPGGLASPLAARPDRRRARPRSR